MNTPPSLALQQLQTASELLRAGKPGPAQAVLEQLLRLHPRLVEARRLLAGALLESGDTARAERELRSAISVNGRWAPSHAALGEVLARAGRADDAERSFRTALRLDPKYSHASVGLARLYVARGRATDAEKLFAALIASGDGGFELLIEHGRALMLLGRREEAIAVFQRAAAAAPRSGNAQLHLAVALLDVGRNVDAENAARNALANGLDTADARFALARALMAQDRFEECEEALRQTLQRDPGHTLAHYNLVEVIWMRTASIQAACTELDAILQRYPNTQALLALKARLLTSAGDAQCAYTAIAAGLAHREDDAMLHSVAANVALEFDAVSAARHATRAIELAPGDVRAMAALCAALLGTGRAEQAARVAAELAKINPDDQHTIALQSSAWRLLGDARYRDLYDYANSVRGWTIDTPPGWPDLPSYLADLARSLRGLHTLKTHPVNQSLRHGTQTNEDLTRSEDPAIRAFFSAIDGPIRRHMQAIGKGKDPLRRRNTGSYKLAGAWSVLLRPDGFHVNHVHAQGWLSSACYIDLPSVVGDDSRQGWIKFGEPGVRTDPALAPEHFVQPKPGLLVLFPSYMWHGTVPFPGAPDETRLTIAFDVVPA